MKLRNAKRQQILILIALLALQIAVGLIVGSVIAIAELRLPGFNCIKPVAARVYTAARQIQ